MPIWIRVVVLAIIGGLAGGQLADLSNSTWWKVTPWVLLVVFWTGLWKNRVRLERREP